jgi:NADH dehydrogenase (ubiquinone) Fe-S protein 7
MLPLARPAVSGALCGKIIPRLSIEKAPCLRPFAVRPRLASCLPRASPIAALSTSSVKSATALERPSSSGQALTASGKVRKEVPLPSQEKKEGAMQYVLYVPLPRS